MDRLTTRRSRDLASGDVPKNAKDVVRKDGLKGTTLSVDRVQA